MFKRQNIFTKLHFPSPFPAFVFAKMCSWLKQIDYFRIIREFAALTAAVFAACAILIPAAHYVRWNNRIGLTFIVLLLYVFIRELMPQLETIFRSRKLLLIAAGAVLAAGCAFFCFKQTRLLTGGTNRIRITPGKFTILELARKTDASKHLPCTGYIVGRYSSWQVGYQQSLTPGPGAGDLFLVLNSRFIKKNRLGLVVSFPRPGTMQYRVNGRQHEFSAPEAGKYLIPLDNVSSLRSTEKDRFSIERAVLFTGLAVTLLLAAALVMKLVGKFSRREPVSWHLMLALSFLFLVYISPFLLYGGSTPDLAAHEPNMPLPCDYKHSILIAIWWRLLHLLIPARSVFISFAFGSLLLYLAGLLMTERFLCKLPGRGWLAWVTFLFGLNALRFYQNRMIVDECLVVIAFFILGLLAMLLAQNSLKMRICCLALFLPLTVMMLGQRHEAIGVAVVFCMAFAGVLIPCPSRLKFRKIAFAVTGGLLLFAALFGVHHLILKKLMPEKDKIVSDDVTVEIRRYQLKEILKICYYGGHYDWLPEDIEECLPPSFSKDQPPLRLTFSANKKKGFNRLSTERITAVWKMMIKQHPFVYLKSKFEGFREICSALDRYRPNRLRRHLCFRFFAPRLPSAVCCVSLLLMLLVSGVLLMCRPVFRGLLFFAAVTAAAGTAHMAALFVVPVSPQARYLYWVYLTGSISFVLLLYFVWLLIWSRLGRASACSLYVIHGKAVPSKGTAKDPGADQKKDEADTYENAPASALCDHPKDTSQLLPEPPGK